MRHWFVLLLMVLLPLRGWSADAMQIHHGLKAPLAHSLHTPSASAPVHLDPASVAAAPAPADAPATHCHEISPSTQDTAPNDGHPPADCQTCDLCHGALLHNLAMSVASAADFSLKPPARVPFASIHALPGHRPPIS